MKEKDLFEIAAYFSKDLRALSTPPKKCADKVPIIKTAILFVTQICFMEFDWDDERQRVTSYKEDIAFIENRYSTARKAHWEESPSKAP